MNLLGNIRTKALWVTVAVGVTVLGVLSLTTLPAWPVVGVALATVALVVNQIAKPLSSPICFGCGIDLTNEPRGEHGVICKNCGTITQHRDDGLA